MRRKERKDLSGIEPRQDEWSEFAGRMKQISPRIVQIREPHLESRTNGESGEDAEERAGKAGNHVFCADWRTRASPHHPLSPTAVCPTSNVMTANLYQRRPSTQPQGSKSPASKGREFTCVSGCLCPLCGTRMQQSVLLRVKVEQTWSERWTDSSFLSLRQTAFCANASLATVSKMGTKDLTRSTRSRGST